MNAGDRFHEDELEGWPDERCGECETVSRTAGKQETPRVHLVKKTMKRAFEVSTVSGRWE